MHFFCRISQQSREWSYFSLILLLTGGRIGLLTILFIYRSPSILCKVLETNYRIVATCKCIPLLLKTGIRPCYHKVSFSVFLLQIFPCWFRTKGKQSNLATIGPDGNCTKYCPFLKAFLFSAVGRCTVRYFTRSSKVPYVEELPGGSQPVSTAVHMEP